MCVFIVGKVDAHSKPTQHRDAAIGCDSFNHGAFYSASYQPEVHRFPCRNYESEADCHPNGHIRARYYNEDLPYAYGESLYRREADNFPPRAVFQASSGGFYEQPHSSAPPQAFLRHDNAGGHMIVPRDVFQTGPRYSDQSRPFGYFGHNNFNYETDYYASRQTSVNRCMYPHQPPPPNAAFYGAHQDNFFRHSSNYM
jgi:hypothetical protein